MPTTQLPQISMLPLGRPLSAARVFTPVAPLANSAGQLYFPSTGHTLSGPFLAYWQAHQGSALLGAPISEPDQDGLGDGTGRVYTVQWFASGRLELHPESKDPRYRVAQGRVGYEYLHRAGLLRVPVQRDLAGSHDRWAAPCRGAHRRCYHPVRQAHHSFTSGARERLSRSPVMT